MLRRINATRLLVKPFDWSCWKWKFNLQKKKFFENFLLQNRRFFIVSALLHFSLVCQHEIQFKSNRETPPAWCKMHCTSFDVRTHHIFRFSFDLTTPNYNQIAATIKEKRRRWWWKHPKRKMIDKNHVISVVKWKKICWLDKYLAKITKKISIFS